MLALVIDDEPALRTVCMRLLGAMGHESEAAAHVADAVAAAQNSTFDLIICDYRLEHETAEDVIDAFRVSAPQQVDRIILASGDLRDPRSTPRARLSTETVDPHEVASLRVVQFVALDHGFFHQRFSPLHDAVGGPKQRADPLPLASSSVCTG